MAESKLVTTDYVQVVGSLLAEPDNEQAWSRLFGACLPTLRPVARSITGDPHLGDDALQEACIRIVRSLHQIKQPLTDWSIKAWLYRIVINAACDARKKQLHRREAAIDAEGMVSSQQKPIEVLSQSDLSQLVRQHFLKLPELQQRVLALHFFSNQSYRDMAAMLDCSEGAARVRLHRSLKRLRRSLLRVGQLCSLAALSSVLQAMAMECHQDLPLVDHDGKNRPCPTKASLVASASVPGASSGSQWCFLIFAMLLLMFIISATASAGSDAGPHDSRQSLPDTREQEAGEVEKLKDALDRLDANLIHAGVQSGDEGNAADMVQLVTIETKDKPLSVVLQWLGRLLPVEMVLEGDLDPLVSIRLVNVTADQAARQLANTYGYRLMKERERKRWVFTPQDPAAVALGQAQARLFQEAQDLFRARRLKLKAVLSQGAQGSCLIHNQQDGTDMVWRAGGQAHDPQLFLSHVGQKSARFNLLHKGQRFAFHLQLAPPAKGQVVAGDDPVTLIRKQINKTPKDPALHKQLAGALLDQVLDDDQQGDRLVFEAMRACQIAKRLQGDVEDLELEQLWQRVNGIFKLRAEPQPVDK